MLKTIDMDQVFKKKLEKLLKKNKSKRFSDDIFNTDLEFAFSNRSENLPKEVNEEQKKIFISLEKYVETKVSNSNNKLKLDGAEISLKTSSEKIRNLNDILQSICLPENLKNRLLNNKISGKIKILFISEIQRQDVADVTSGDAFLDQLNVCFQDSTANLFKKMIQAMNLGSDEFILFPYEFDQISFSSELLALCEYFKIPIMVTLGSKSTNLMLNNSERLNFIHGQFFNKKISDNFSFDIVPLYHPSILETNQNMKKTAWVDMQKIMKFLEKFS